MKCWNCDIELEEGSVFCTHCGKKQGQKVPITPPPKPVSTIDYEELQRKLRGCTTTQQALDLFSQYPQSAGDATFSMLVNQRINELGEKKEEKIKTQQGHNLWTWIRTGRGEKALYENDSNPNLEADEFMVCVSKKLEVNRVPAKLTKIDVRWDEGKQYTKEYLVDVRDSSIKNPFSMLVQFVKVGKFSFVGENLFITPPVLPKFPDQPKEVPTSSGVLAIIIGCVVALLSMGMASLSGGGAGLYALIGLAIAGYGVFVEINKSSIKQHNAKCIAEKKAWDDAWDNWYEEQVEYVFQQVVNGKLECIRSAVVKTIQQVCKEKFQAAPVMEESAQVNQSELEEAIAKRRQAVL